MYSDCDPRENSDYSSDHHPGEGEVRYDYAEDKANGIEREAWTYYSADFLRNYDGDARELDYPGSDDFCEPGDYLRGYRAPKHLAGLFDNSFGNSGSSRSHHGRVNKISNRARDKESDAIEIFHKYLVETDCSEGPVEHELCVHLTSAGICVDFSLTASSTTSSPMSARPSASTSAPSAASAFWPPHVDQLANN
jgi:hypothetical protein